MVVNHVEDYREAACMRGVDKPPQSVRTAVAFLDGEDGGRVVAPRNIGRKFVGRKQLDRIDPELDEVIEVSGDRVEGPPSVAVAGIEVEGRDMQFVDNELVPGRARKSGARPRIIRLSNDAVADRVGHGAGVRIVLPQWLVAERTGEDEFVLIVELRA